MHSTEAPTFTFNQQQLKLPAPVSPPPLVAFAPSTHRPEKQTPYVLIPVSILLILTHASVKRSGFEPAAAPAVRTSQSKPQESQKRANIIWLRPAA